jgi:ribosome recycling factor
MSKKVTHVHVKDAMDKSTILAKAKDEMEKTILALQHDLQKVRSGRASPALLDDVRVDSYGKHVALNKVATIAAPEARLLTITPFDKGILTVIEKAILTSGLGLTPNNDGKVVRIPIPALSQDRRQQIAKQLKDIAEDSKVSLRRHRQDANNLIKSVQKEHSWSTDEAKRASDEVQKVTDTYTKKIDELCAKKEKEVLTM